MAEIFTQIDLPEDLLHKIGQTIVDIFIHESKKDFARRGISGRAPDGSVFIWDSFSYRVHRQTVEIMSTFPLTEQSTPKRQSSTGHRPLITRRTSGGSTIFQMTPLKLKDGWVHPGILRFSFIERARRAAQAAVLRILKEEAVRAMIRSRQ